MAAFVFASDKINLSVFRGDKAAWSIYPTLACMPLFGSKTSQRPNSPNSPMLSASIRNRLFHAYIEVPPALLIEDKKRGVPMTRANSFIRRVYPILLHTSPTTTNSA